MRVYNRLPAVYFNLGPTRLPATIVSRLHAEVVKAVQAPDIREKFSAMALETVAGTPAGFKAMVEAERSNEFPVL